MASACEKTTCKIAPIGAILQLCFHVEIGFRYYQLIADFGEHLSQQMKGKVKDSNKF